MLCLSQDFFLHPPHRHSCRTYSTHLHFGFTLPNSVLLTASERQHLGRERSVGNLPRTVSLSIYISRRHATSIRFDRRSFCLPGHAHHTSDRYIEPKLWNSSDADHWSGFGCCRLARCLFRNGNMASVLERWVLLRVWNGLLVRHCVGSAATVVPAPKVSGCGPRFFRRWTGRCRIQSRRWCCS